MAEPAYRPLSRGHHNVKIPVESPPIMQTVHPMETGVRADYSEVNVYETTVRPKSRREGLNRPKSGYNNRFRRESSRVGATTSATHRDEPPDERPRTSRGGRDHSSSRHTGEVSCSDAITASRPKSGYGSRRGHDVTSQNNDAGPERPQSRRARRISHDPSPRTPPPPSGPMLQRERTLYDIATSQRPNEGGDERPRTRGGRSSQMSDYAGSVPSTPRNTSNPAERPKTGHGRRRQHSLSDDYSGIEASPRASTERPPSRAGRKARNSYDNSDNTYSGGGKADILVVEEDRPRTSRARRRNIPIDLSYMATSNNHEPVMSPSPSPRPPTGRSRPKSSRRQKVSKPPNSPAYEYERQMTTTPVSMSRPSSSLNRFTPLPAIGAHNDQGSPGYHIHIPYAGEASTAPNNNNSSEPSSTNYLSEHAKRLHIQDNEQQPSIAPAVQQEPALYQPLEHPVHLPLEPDETQERLILAIKLPDGTRVQRAFRPTDQLHTVMNFAELSAQLDFGRCELVCDVPRQVYRDLSVTVQESGLQNRTVLHVQTPDE